MKEDKLVLKLVLGNIIFWTKRKWNKITTRRGERSLDDFYNFARRSKNL